MRSFLRNWAIGSTAIVAVSVALHSTGGAAPVSVVADAEPVPGMAGTDTSLPLTDSAVTVRGRGPFESLEITVNQTRNLTNQAVSITWEGGRPTIQGPGRFAANYLQIMQCWGDPVEAPDGSVGPPAEQCVQGATSGTYEGLPFGVAPNGSATTRLMSVAGWGTFHPRTGYFDPRTGVSWRPFRAVRGEVVDVPVDPFFNPSTGGNYWLNPYFDIVTTNEIAAAATGADGRGADLFEVETGVQSAGLGCGQRVQPVPGGEPRVPQCWIVIVPRGTPAEENLGTPDEQLANQVGVTTSPLSSAAWENRIAIPIEFNSVDPSCAIGQDERRIAGNELPLLAIASWQPALCATGELPPFSYAPMGDALARQQIVSGTVGAPGMVAVNRPLAPELVPDDDPVVYAPLTLSGLAIGFNSERFPLPTAPDAAQQLSGVRVAEINLTPRLVAKLLTQSYTQALPIGDPPDSYAWAEGSPPHLGADPDFVRFNPEYSMLQIANQRTFSGLQLPSGTSDAAQLVWEWILADPEAAAWLAGEPDDWGMRVNPYYATDPAINPTGSGFAAALPTSFPKADPFCHEEPPATPAAPVPPPLCGTDWLPYVRSLADAARITRSAADGARVVLNTFAGTAGDVWKRESPQLLGRRSILALTDSASAARFGLQTARLSRAGDNDAEREFVSADVDGLTRGATAMVAGDDPQVAEPDPLVDAPGAYPLTTLTYAAIAPLSLDEPARADYAEFIRRAATSGQVPGFRPGDLPSGYAPLPGDLQVQAAGAADLVQTLVPPPPTTTTTTTTLPEPTTTSALPPPPTTSPPVAPAPIDTTPPDVPFQAGPSGNAPPPAAPPAAPRPSAATSTSTTTAPTVPPTTEPEPAPSTPATTEPPPVGDEPPAEPEDAPVLTPLMSLGRSRFAVPGLGVVGLGSALGALEITKRPRRSTGRIDNEASEES